MYRFVTVLILALLIGNAAGATESVSTDGVWWDSLNADNKVAATFAATSAYSQGYLLGALAMEDAYEGALLKAVDSTRYTAVQKVTIENTVFQYETRAFKQFRYPDFSGKPIKAYIDGMDYFYSNHPDAMKVDISEVLQCIQNRPTKSCDVVAGAK